MRCVKIAGSNIISSLGFTSEENFQNILNENSGLCFHSTSAKHPLSLINAERFNNCCSQYDLSNNLTRFEKLCILSIKDAISQSSVNIESKDCLIVLATTKGNISLLETGNERSESIHLWSSASKIQAYFQAVNTPLVISNACVSSVSAQVLAVRMLTSEHYKNIIVCGADIISDFIVSGFQALMALSSTPCRPFDLKRDGLSLGEGVGTLILSVENFKGLFEGVTCLGGALSNDANHISGPSRTGDGLAKAITTALERSDVTPGFISAHGTATLYNDEMESKAIKLAQLQNIPLNSLKGYYGHTLGAAGIIETIITLWGLEHSKAVGTLGHNEYGVSEKINLIGKTHELRYNSFLKIASGFGGCNAAILYSK